jgi:pSer/pThr/pTyr-binding forkhead associated (FHA) protein
MASTLGNPPRQSKAKIRLLDRADDVEIGIEATEASPGDEVMHIGRGLAANLRLDDSSVSRRHAVLISRPSGHRILDDRSLNGTFVNGKRIEQSDLRNGDLIAIGRVMLLYLDA